MEDRKTKKEREQCGPNLDNSLARIKKCDSRHAGRKVAQNLKAKKNVPKNLHKIVAWRTGQLFYLVLMLHSRPEYGLQISTFRRLDHRENGAKWPIFLDIL